MNALRALGPLLAAAAVAACLSGCGYHEDILVDDPEYWPITVENRSAVVLDIYLDDEFRVTVTPDTVATLYDIHEGHHLLEAYDEDGYRRADRRFYLDTEYIWILE